jgi:hypothetical protein
MKYLKKYKLYESYINPISDYLTDFIGFEIFRDFLENKKLTIQQPSNPTKLCLK